MASPGSANQRSTNNPDVEQFLRERIWAAKEALHSATTQMERSPQSRRAKNQYSEAFYHYCQALYEASMYAAHGVQPPEASGNRCAS